MSRSRFVLTLSLLLACYALPAAADQYDDCLANCQQAVAPCVEQARLNAGNIQEEEDSIAACEKGKAGCIQACRDAETQPQPPQEQPPELPQEQSQGL